MKDNAGNECCCCCGTEFPARGMWDFNGRMMCRRCYFGDAHYREPEDFGDEGCGPEECPHCAGTGWQDLNGTMAMECPECGGGGYET